LKFHPEIKILLKLGCQQTTCITNKTRDAIKKKSLTNEIENWRTTFKNILLNKNTIMNGVYMWSQLFQSGTSCPKICRRIFDYN